jgi:fatty-acyl-CoA synthase/long-chain acyl-CoA synthetase
MSVFPAEVEALLGRHPLVVGAAVVGRPDPERGEVPVAFVRVDPQHQDGLTEEDLAVWCRQNMAVYKVPEIRFVAEFPLTATGKVKKEALLPLLQPA